ncbi:ABC transporter transmembrane domain-containing protein [Sphingomonas naphthae]|uniref:ABC transporter transmembrane domain-containing protein n=1 Tax=Sphingomonas naphthae TaxID=1813468 RepID=A0ABY7TQ40_9SPHN|nr:ABC transporter transmembrane domain-containing protein [Sphingomonas naphthae]WCT75348.1 ABC transporter transmembrane domain-containing protein [Sphingomonas naphthae]
MARSPRTLPDSPGATSRDLGNLLLVWRQAARYPFQIAMAALAMLMAAAATLAIPQRLQRIIDRGFANENANVGTYFHYLLMIVAVLALATAMRFYFVSWLGERVVADIRIRVQKNLLTLAPRFFEENRPSEIASRLTADTTLIEQIVGVTVSVASRNLVMAIGGVIYLFTLAPKLTGLLLLGIPLVIVPIVVLGRRVRKASRATQDQIAAVGTVTNETLGAMKIVQAFGQEGREGERFANTVETTFAVARSRIGLRAVMTSIVILLVFGSIVMVMWQGASDVASGHLSGGTLAAFMLTGALVAGAFGALTETYGDLLRGAGAAGRLAELLREIPEIRAPAEPVPLPTPARGELVFDAVSFRYPTRPDTSALSDFSLTVSPGQTVAVVGPSGAGKSTLFALAERFYDPYAGEVRLDGVALTAADPAEVRARIAMVPQDTVIFAASARDNLRYGSWEASDEAIWAAAEQANAATFLRALPQGLDTYLGEGGARLSGGQRQRLAIARALLRDAPLLLLDEATSALDAESERLVQGALERLMKDRTTVVIAHRLATVRSADLIVVMDDGRIVEQGRHDALVAAGGLYARLARLQFDAVA